MEDKPKVYFRADGNAQIGLGHIVRCLALAEMLSSDFLCHFIIQQPLPTLKEQILEVCNEIIELENSTISISEAKNIANLLCHHDIIVLDGYNFETAYQQELKKQGIKIVCIDDIHAYHFVADVIVNHAGGIGSDQYSYEPNTRLFLGLPYALLRKPFRESAKNRIKNKPNNIFICLGGADPNNDILNVLKKIEETGEESLCYVVVGGAYLHQKEMKGFLKNTKLKVKLLKDLSAGKLVFYMNRCSRAITSPSTISYEYLSTGGLLYLKLTADNQQHINSYFLDNRIALSFDNDFNNDTKTSHNWEKAFDGKQQQRFINIFYDIAIATRIANSKDCNLYFNWVNDPLTRQQSFNSAPITFQEHNAWFSRKLEDKGSFLYIVELDKNPIGQIRFQTDKHTATISYSVDKNYRGKGLGFWVLKKGIETFRNAFPNIGIIAFVKFENIESIKIFKKLDFQETIDSEVKNSYKYLLN